MSAHDDALSPGDPLRALVHDLRTPLAIVLGFSELLERRARELDPAQRDEYVGRIAAAARQMRDMLDEAPPIGDQGRTGRP